MPVSSTLDPPSTRLRRLGVAGAAGAVALALAPVAPAGAAGADAVARQTRDGEGCTPAPSGYSCFYVEGSGLRVTKADVIRGKASWDMICDYQAKVTASLDGEVYATHWSNFHDGCSIGRAYMTARGAHTTYKDGTRLCGRFYESGVPQGGAACITIRA